MDEYITVIVLNKDQRFHLQCKMNPENETMMKRFLTSEVPFNCELEAVDMWFTAQGKHGGKALISCVQ